MTLVGVGRSGVAYGEWLRCHWSQNCPYRPFLVLKMVMEVVGDLPGVFSEVTKGTPGPVVIPGFDICYLEPILRTIDFGHFLVPSTPKRLVGFDKKKNRTLELSRAGDDVEDGEACAGLH